MEMFPNNAQWLWENFDHKAIEHICEEKRNIDKFLNEDDEDSSSSSPYAKPAKHQKQLDVLNQEFLIYEGAWDLLKDLHNLTKEDYTEEEIQEIIKREEKRKQADLKSKEEHIQEKESKRKEFEDLLEKGLEKQGKGYKAGDSYLTEDQLENLSLEANESVFKFESQMIEEDLELWS